MESVDIQKDVESTWGTDSVVIEKGGIELQEDVASSTVSNSTTDKESIVTDSTREDQPEDQPPSVVYVVYVGNIAKCYVTSEDKARETVEEYISDISSHHSNCNYSIYVERFFDNQVAMIYGSYKFFVISYDRFIQGIRYERVSYYG